MNVFLAQWFDGYETRGSAIYADLATAIRLSVEKVLHMSDAFYHSHWWEPQPEVQVKEREYGGIKSWEISTATCYDTIVIREEQVIEAADVARPDLTTDTVIALAKIGVDATIHTDVIMSPARDTTQRKMLAGHYIGKRYHYHGKGEVRHLVNKYGRRAVMAMNDWDEATLNINLKWSENKSVSVNRHNKKAVRGLRRNDRMKWNHTVNALKQWEDAA